MKEKLMKVLNDLQTSIREAKKDPNFELDNIVLLKACWADLHWAISEIDKYGR